MKKTPILLFTFLLASCDIGGAPGVSSSTEASSPISTSPLSSSSSETARTLEAADIENLYVYRGDPVAPVVKDSGGTILNNEQLTFSFEGDDIRYENGGFIGLRGNSSTLVTVTDSKGASGSFSVKVANRPYREQHGEAAENEGWFDEISVDPIASLDEGFANGMDISSAAYIYERCGEYYGAFYNEAGDEQSLFQIIADHKVNWVRLRLWVDPYNHNLLDSEGNPTPYGAGICSYEYVEWMAREAKAAGLKVLLNFHYSDFYAHPGQQVIPKAWSSISSAQEMGDTIYEYTKSTLEDMKAADALPDAVQIGNETTTGMLTQLPGTDYNRLTGDNPGYIADSYNAPSSIAGSVGSSNWTYYLGKANAAVKDVDGNILTMVHLARGLTASDDIINYFRNIESVDYDIIGLSCYVYYQWSNPSTLRTHIGKIAAAFPDKLICAAEHAYGYTYEEDMLGNWIFSKYEDPGAAAVSSYEVNVQGQADCIHDLTEAVANLSNGWGAFYWEPAWRIRAGCGWSDASSRNSWANQGLFSLDGKALGSLAVYEKMYA